MGREEEEGGEGGFGGGCVMWVGLGDTDSNIDHTYWKSLHENKKCGEGYIQQGKIA